MSRFLGLLSLPQNFLHGLTFGQLVHQLVQVADILHQRIFDQFHLDTSDAALDK